MLGNPSQSISKDRHHALMDILKVVSQKSAQLVMYASALGAIALLPKDNIPALLTGIAGGIGVNLMSNIIDRVAQGEDISHKEILDKVEIAISNSKIDELLRTDKEILYQITRLTSWQRYLVKMIQSSNKDIESMLLQQFAQMEGIQANLEEILELIQISLGEKVLINTNYEHQFRTLIEDKTKGFVGRDHVFAAINDFINRYPKGYLEIEGDPGVGKSAILAEYARRKQKEVIVYFNIRSQGINTARHFLKSICTQLINRYALPFEAITAESMQDGAFLALLLDKLSNKLNKENPLVIAIDALDEVDLSGQPEGTNILFLPMTIPDYVFFVLTRRPTSLPLTIHVARERFNIMAYLDENIKDIQTYIRRVAEERPKLRNWADKHSGCLTFLEFVLTLAEKSENNFMYLRYVLPDIENGLYEDLSIENLPVGLEGYYESHWSQMGMKTQPLPYTKLKIIYLLSEIKRPATRRLIAEFAMENEVTAQQILDEWSQFLHEYIVDNQFRYSIYHSSFRDFLHRKDIVQAAGVDISNIHRLITDNFWTELFEYG